jgi:integrase
MAKRKRDRYLYEIPKKSGRWYLWAGKGHPRYRVNPSEPNFNTVYGNFRAGIVPKKPIRESEPKPAKTLNYGLLQFYKSSPYILWKPDRRRQIRGLLDAIADEESNEGKVGDIALDRFKLFDLQRIVDRKIEKNLYAAANNRRDVLRILWGWLRKNGFVKDDVSQGLDVVKVPKEFQRRHTITESEIRQYREYWDYTTKERLGFELGMAGAACADVVKLGPQHLVERNGIQYLEYYRTKTLHKDEPELAVVEVHEELAIAIKTHIPTRKDNNGNLIPVIGNTTFLITEKGRLNYDAQHYGSRKVFKKWCKQAGLLPRVTTHSLRRGAAVGLIHGGSSHEEINTAQGRARGSRVISVYLKDLDKRRIADLASARKRKEQS